MAGSRRSFEYITDNNEKYTVVLDESNSEATIEDTPLLNNRTAAHPLAPRGLRLRYFLAESIGVRRLQRKFYVGDPVLLVGLQAPIIIVCAPYPDSAPVDWEVTAYRGERNKIVRGINTTGGDTGLNDGDQGRDENPN